MTKKATVRKSKPVPRKSGAKKTAKKKKATKKRLMKKKAATKKTAGRKALRKKAVKKPVSVRKKTGAKRSTPQKTVMVKPGPSPTGIPPVEEPARNEEAIGTVSHYYSHLAVAIVQINKSSLSTGDLVHIKGHTTDFTQKVESMEFEHQPVEKAVAGQSVGIRVKDHAREHDIVYRVRTAD